MTEQIKLYDIGHWQHSRYDNFYEIGRTIYNADNYSKPVIRNGKAPCGLLDVCYNWHTLTDAESSLKAMGFVKVNDIVWSNGNE